MNVQAQGILASAGTGKTYALTTRLLELLISGSAPPSLFAATFTRTAAGEILDRVLRRLCEAAEDPEKLERLRKDLQRPALTQESCRHIAATVGRSLDRLAVSTLDAFLVRVATAFAVEIGLPPGWRITSDDEDARIRRAAVGRVLREAGTPIIMPLLRMLKKSEGERSVRESIASVVDAVHDVHVQSMPGSWGAVGPIPGALDNAGLRTAAEVIRGAALPVTKGTGKPHAAWAKAREKLLAQMSEQDWDGLLDGGLGAAVVGTRSYSRVDFSPELLEIFGVPAKHARAGLVERLRQQNQAAAELAERFHAAYEQLKQEQGGIRFDDVPRLLMAEDMATIRDELYYRLDARIEHVLLDEFQDTSVSQFRVIEPLIAEIVSDETRGRSFFYVGDAKQSLFGWRHAEPELLRTLGTRWSQIQVVEKASSYRSAPEIISAVNRVLGGIAQSPVREGDACERAAEQWNDLFTLHTWDEKLKDVPGKVVLREFPKIEEGDSGKEGLAAARCEYIARRVRELRVLAPRASIGVLLRNKTIMPRLLMALADLGIDATEEGGSPLTQSPAVAAIASLLRVAEHPGDTLAAFHVGTTALGDAVGLSRRVDPATVSAVSGELRERITRAGVGPVIAEWARWLSPVCQEMDRVRLGQMVECAEQFDQRGGLGIRAFLEMLEVTRRPAGVAASVHVMTIHAAKGLEFDAVVVPELDGLVPARTPEVLYEREDLMGPITGLSLYAPKVVQEASPELRRMAVDRGARDIRESLCLLYVAMTRARRYLEMIVMPQSASGSSFRLSRVVRAALAGDVEGPDESGVLYESGSDRWPIDPRAAVEAEESERGEGKGSADAGAAGVFVVLGMAPVGVSSKAVTASGLADGAKEVVGHGEEGPARSAERIASRRAARGLGTGVHACLEQIEWLEDGPISEARLRGVLAGIDLPFDLEEDKVLAAFRKVIAREEVARILRRDRYLRGAGRGEKVELHRELGGVTIDRQGRTVRNRMDRVVVVSRGGRAVAAEIIDWKTDGMVGARGEVEACGPSEAQQRARARAYGPQMGAYRSVVCKALGLKERDVRTTVVFVAWGTVITLDPGED